MKRVYIKPNVKVVKSCIECMLVSESGGQITDPRSKGHNSSFNFWDEEQPSGFTNKNLWDD